MKRFPSLAIASLMGLGEASPTSAAPAGSVVRTHGDYRYYFADGRHYYPSMDAGRTVHVEIETDSSGAPLPPPACEDVELSF